MTNAIRDLNFYSTLEEHVRSYPGKVALADAGTRFTFAELLDRVDRLANALEDSGVSVEAVKRIAQTLN